MLLTDRLSSKIFKD